MESPIIESTSVSDLIFDPLNPRIPKSRRGLSEDEILKFMIRKENVVDLIASIGEQNFFPGEPLLIISSKEHTGKFEVVEGNRRLAALKLLQKPEGAKTKEKTIKALVDEAKFKPKNVQTILFKKREDVLDYLGYRHITGVDAWDSLQKARYLEQLWNRHKSGNLKGLELGRHIAKLIGSRTDYVFKLINGFRLYSEIEENEFYDINNLNEETFSFSLLTTAVSYSNIRKFLEIDYSEEVGFSINTPDRLRELTTWMFKEDSEQQTRIPESRALKTLNSVVANENALQKFRDGRSLEEAGLLTDEPRKNFNKLVEQAYNRLSLAHDSVKLIEKFTDQDESLTHDTFKLARSVYISVKGTREEDELN